MDAVPVTTCNADSSKTSPSEGRITEHFLRCMEVARQPRQPEPIQPVAVGWLAQRTECLWHRCGLMDLHRDGVGQIDPARAPWGQVYSILDRQGQTDAGYIVVFAGIRGTGKTQCAAHLIRRTVERREEAIYTTVAGMIRRIYDSYDADKAQQRTRAIEREFADARLLVLDECHEGLKAESARSIFTGIMDARYARHRRNTILICNEKRDNLGALFGDSVSSRIIEKGRVFEFTNPSFRTTPAWAKVGA